MDQFSLRLAVIVDLTNSFSATSLSFSFYFKSLIPSSTVSIQLLLQHHMLKQCIFNHQSREKKNQLTSFAPEVRKDI